MKIKHNKNILIAITFLAILLVVVLIFIPKKTEGCKSDKDCIKQQATCCSCNMGGEEKCMKKQEAKNWKEELEKCDKNILCIALYNCRETKCKCVKGECIEE